MLAKIKIVNSPGKLFTSNVKNGQVGDFQLVNTKCRNENCHYHTQKIIARGNTEVFGNVPELPTLWVFAGGVGSFQFETRQDWTNPIQTWNWSRRGGSLCVLNPVCVIEGYTETKDLPEAPAGQIWVTTYLGNTLRTHVLLHQDMKKHALPFREGTPRLCPVCQEKEFIESEFSKITLSDGCVMIAEKENHNVVLKICEKEVTGINLEKRKIYYVEQGSNKIHNIDIDAALYDKLANAVPPSYRNFLKFVEGTKMQWFPKSY